MTATSPPVFTLFMLLHSQPAWLALTRVERAAYVEAEVAPVLARWPQVAMRFYDAEAFTGRCTDLMVFETADLAAYAHLVDGLRDTAFLGRPYFEVVEIIPALEDGYKAYDAAA
ncbi:darcynin family protein [Phenylobacterium aquaticum]|uniref:darcynin family protein n=1 Tax=Phenylobacterium aquaticum TaxID=1763816 RepID=UPI001F5C18D3|nr:darcynin family protein [Phenylobacterium aquaticum]MCI3135139.1 darcynin [Phenylobacterium aquaticum]